MVKNYPYLKREYQYIGTKRLVLLSMLAIFGALVFQGWSYVFSKYSIAPFSIMFAVLFFSFLMERYTPLYLRIVDGKVLQHTDTSRVFFGIRRSYLIEQIRNLNYYSFAGSESIETIRTVNGKEVRDRIWAVNVYDMKTIREFLKDITEINPNIKLDKTVQEWKDNPEAKFKEAI